MSSKKIYLVRLGVGDEFPLPTFCLMTHGRVGMWQRRAKHGVAGVRPTRAARSQQRGHFAYLKPGCFIGTCERDRMEAGREGGMEGWANVFPRRLKMQKASYFTFLLMWTWYGCIEAKIAIMGYLGGYRQKTKYLSGTQSLDMVR